MIDTIVLTPNQNMFTVLDKDKFNPSANYLYDEKYRYYLGGRANFRCYQNPTPNELRQGFYKPRLTITKRFNKFGGFDIPLRIEFSALKMLFGNNFDELTDVDLPQLIAKLNGTLKQMGVFIFEEILLKSSLSAIHYSKNIALTDGSIPFSILKEIQKANVTQRLDFNQSDFRNEGHLIKFRANTFETVFYDKFKDMGKAKISEKRAVEKDNAIQMGLFDKLNQARHAKPLEILRMEVRLNTRQKIRQILGKIGYDIEPTLQNLFKKEISQKVLLFHLNEIENVYPKTLYFEPKSNKDFMTQFMIDNPKEKLKTVVLALGFSSALKELNTREIREQLKKYPVSSWYRFIRQMNSYNYTKTRPSVFEPIIRIIEEFKPLKLVDFQAEMINNDKYN